MIRRFFRRFLTANEAQIELEDNVDRYLIVGLGNPGRKHQNNRHNIGFMIVDELANKYDIHPPKVQNKTIISIGRLADQSVILAKPQTFMNKSGDAVGPLARYYKVPPAHTIVIYDELDIPFGTIRLREKGGAGGHNGMRSIIQHLGRDFPRLRMGIGRPPGQMPPAAYVLQDFGKADKPVVDEMIHEAIQAIETYLREGIHLAMTRHNGSVIND